MAADTTATQTPLSISIQQHQPSTSSALHSAFQFQFQPQSMAAMKIALLAVAAMAVLLGTASAVTYNVGDQGGWTLSTDYSSWVSGKKFNVGDEIVFKYSTPTHDVVEVSKAGYDSCSIDGAINTLASGNDVITLNATGTRYFICGVPNHCSPTAAASMKVVINVASGSSSPSSPMPAAGPGASNSPPAPPSNAATSVGATAGFGLVALLAAGLMA
ncbi:blue copper protein 1a [Aegilops tauschii subsp. strangulata]|nr:blue copper protein 1a [Aegilops tauschii subsp. strangulata]XP_044376381.1 blue copper protein 1a-like [Triticum aestivum]